ncbi:MAG TPA: hypothetical protein VMT87_13920 [Vicinamibacteria bacterium]|nr:hypothetical protein [Vicinamibacteria bacterium]
MPVLRAAALYTLLTAALTWPLLTRLHVMDAGDSAFFAWAIGWELHALKTDPSLLPHGPIFHPLRHTLGFDEPILGTTLLVAPLGLFTSDAVFLFNVARLLTFLLSALTAYLLARELGCAEGPALFAGAAFAFSPIRTDQIAHLSTLGSQWLPLVLLFLHRYVAAGRWRDALLSALVFALATYACGYHGLIGLAVLPPAALVLLWGRWRRLPAAVAAAMVAAALLLPLYVLHQRALAPLGYERGTGETVVYSAALESFLATTSWNRVYGEATAEFRSTNANNLFPGLVLPALAAVGAWWLLRHGRRPGRDAIALAVMGGVAALVALGPELRVLGHVLGPGPFALVREIVPAFRMIRVPSRAGIFIALALALLAAKALTLWRPRTPRMVALTALALAETLIVPIPMPAWAQVVDSRQPPPEVYRWLAAQAGDPVVVELPIFDIYGIFRRPAYHESIYLIHQTHHWKPLANGYAGIEPAPYLDLRRRARRFPSADALAAFRERGVRYVILHRGGFGPNQWARIERDLGGFGTELKEVARFGGDTVYEVMPAP